jgi:hypothetical protein
VLENMEPLGLTSPRIGTSLPTCPGTAETASKTTTMGDRSKRAMDESPDAGMVPPSWRQRWSTLPPAAATGRSHNRTCDRCRASLSSSPVVWRCGRRPAGALPMTRLLDLNEGVLAEPPTMGLVALGGVSSSYTMPATKPREWLGFHGRARRGVADLHGG